MTEDTAKEQAAAGGAQLLDTPDAGPTVIRGGAVRTAGYVIGVLMSVAAAPLMIRHLGAVDFGRYVTVISIITIVAALTEAGLNSIGVREYSLRDDAGQRRLIRNLLGMRVALTFAGVLLAVGFSVVAGYPDVVVGGTAIAGLGLLVGVVQLTYHVPLATELRLGWITAIELVRQTATVVAIVVLVVAGATLLPFYAITLVAALAALVLNVALVRGRVPLTPSADFGEWWALVRDVVAYAAASAIGVIYFRIEVVLMSLIASEQETGYFSASFRIVEILAGIPLLASMSVLPILSRAARDDAARLSYALQRLFEVYLIAGTAIGLAFLFGSDFAIDVIAGDDFEESVDVLQIMGVAMVGTFLVSIWGFALLALGRHRALLGANLFALALAGVLTALLVPDGGAEGAAIATAATEFALAAIYAVLLMRGRDDLRVRLGVVPRVLVAAGAGAGVAVLSGLASAPAALVATAVYAVGLVLLRAVPREVFDAFRGFAS